MADVNVNFVHPTDGRVINATIDDSMTSNEVIAELVSHDFIKYSPQGYNLAIKGGSRLLNQQTLRDAGTAHGTTFRVIPATDAGYHLC
ncbi:hypothetical protein [Hugenholtzia roseola]|uniref:hypothetical protein n=1 Tax=Hugenholtzia roseola TaxID=1002 RepID=UPI0004136B0F|nr:hypothetical protein [Hugenholtzia roseola]